MNTPKVLLTVVEPATDDTNCRVCGAAVNLADTCVMLKSRHGIVACLCVPCFHAGKR